MPNINYTVQDLLGVFIGFLLFILVLVIPGYVTGYIFNLFDFKNRQPLVRFGIGLLLSCAISPVLFFLTYRLVSNTFTLVLLFGFASAFAIILSREHDLTVGFKGIAGNKSAIVIVWISALWILFGALLLVDIQWGNRLYFNIVTYDYSTRTAVINAITRTGVPPINPGFFPGEPVKLTFLYYFWYILCSLVDQMGGNIVDSRASLIASAIWAGIALIATVALYLRIRNSVRPSNPWRSALTGVGLLAVSGLDFLGSTFYIIFPQYLVGYYILGDIEHWNEQVTAWIGTAIWTPHHLVALLNGILAWLLVVYHQDKRLSQKLSSGVIAGLAFASAFGLSTWITLIFFIFWIFLISTRLLKGEPIRDIWNFLIPGVIGAIAILPFILDFYGGGGASTAASPLAFNVRIFRPVLILLAGLPVWVGMLVNLFLLPLNYFLELGFFLLVGIYWYQHCGKEQRENNPFIQGEIILLLISSILATFARSTLIANNDFGWRGWLPGQFILIVWGTDILDYVWNKKASLNLTLFRKPLFLKGTRIVLGSLIFLGAITTLQDLLLLRTWPILLDTGWIKPANEEVYNGERVFEARSAYGQIDRLSSEDAIIQSESGLRVDRPSGLYATRGSAVSNLTLYGVSPEKYEPLMERIKPVFETQTNNWQDLDEACQHYSIDVLIIKDSNALWKSVDQLKSEREPLYAGKYYAVFFCGRSQSIVIGLRTSGE